MLLNQGDTTTQPPYKDASVNGSRNHRLEWAALYGAHIAMYAMEYEENTQIIQIKGHVSCQWLIQMVNC
jgi:hypothetical protein